jgi:hypothetical protein
MTAFEHEMPFSFLFFLVTMMSVPVSELVDKLGAL